MEVNTTPTMHWHKERIQRERQKQHESKTNSAGPCLQENVPAYANMSVLNSLLSFSCGTNSWLLLERCTTVCAWIGPYDAAHSKDWSAKWLLWFQRSHRLSKTACRGSRSTYMQPPNYCYCALKWFTHSKMFKATGGENKPYWWELSPEQCDSCWTAVMLQEMLM